MLTTIDTNVLLNNPKHLYKVNYAIIPIVVLKEIDNLKRNKDCGYQARRAIKEIKKFMLKHPDRISFDTDGYKLETNDDLIIQSALKTNSSICTEDLAMTILSESMNIKVELIENKDIYDPCSYIKQEHLPQSFSFNQKYLYKNLEDFGIISLINRRKDEWFFIVIKLQDRFVVYANLVTEGTVVRIDNIPSCEKIRNKKKRINIHAKDIYQMMAIFLLKEAPNVLITGSFGTGKTLLSTAAVIDQNLDRTFVGRVPSGIDKRYSIGYLPGSKKDKLQDYLQGVISSLYYIYGNTSNQYKDKIQYDLVQDEILPKYFNIVDLNTIQGLSLSSDYLLIDEVQYLTTDAMSAVLSRTSNASKLIMVGDLKQSHQMSAYDSGLLKLLKLFPTKDMAYINLKQNYRGGLSNIAEKLIDSSTFL